MGWLAKTVGVGIAGSLVWGGVAYAASSGSIVVDRVIDGDTLDVRMGGDIVRVRLLNIDTPETKDPDQPVECLGPEASKFLSDRLPPGTKITLEYDVERTDRYGRTLAGVYESGHLVNAEIAAAGLGAPVVFEPNRRFYDEVSTAAGHAEADQVGAYAPAAACMLPVQVQAATAALVAAWNADEDWDTAAGLEAAIATFRTPVAVANALVRVIEGAHDTEDPSIAAFYSDQQLKSMQDAVGSALERADAQVNFFTLTLQEKRDEAAKAKADQAAKKKAAAAKQKAEQAAKKKAAAKKHTRRSSSGGGSGGGGYNGPRCYDPGGRTWHPC